MKIKFEHVLKQFRKSNETCTEQVQTSSQQVPQRRLCMFKHRGCKGKYKDWWPNIRLGNRLETVQTIENQFMYFVSNKKITQFPKGDSSLSLRRIWMKLGETSSYKPPGAFYTAQGPQKPPEIPKDLLSMFYKTKIHVYSHILTFLDPIWGTETNW